MATKRKARTSNSATRKTAIMGMIKEGIEAPVPLNPQQQEIFDTLISGLPIECWEPPRIRLAANLAKLIAYHEENMEELMIEGPVIENNRGTPITNPRQGAMAQNMSMIKALTATLGLSASQRGIKETGLDAKRRAEKEAREALDKTDNEDDESLLAGG